MASAAGTRALFACGSVGVCAVLLAVRAEPAFAQEGGSGGGDRSVTVPPELRDLWSEYPLNPPRPPVARPRQSTAERGEARNQPNEPGEGWNLAVLGVAAAVAGAIVVLVALAVLVGLRPAWVPNRSRGSPRAKQRTRRMRRPRVRTMPRQERAMADRSHRLIDAHRKPEPPTPPNDAATPTPESLPSEDEIDKLELDSPDARERSDIVRTSKPARPEKDDANASYAQVGEQVAAVLASAQKAADEIRATAEEEAERIRAEIEERVAATRAVTARAVQEARRESEALRTEADEYSRETREAADRYVAETRQLVEDEAAERLTEVEQQAREIHRAAEGRARELETEGLQRQKALVEEAGRTEARLEQLLGVFHGMTSQLEALVHAERAADEAVDAQDDGPAEELAEDLRPGRPGRSPAKRIER
jgi:hypothetical protein